MQGVDALTNAASALEKVSPGDRYQPFCYSLLRLIRPFIERDLKSRGFDQELIDTVYQAAVSSGDLTQPWRSVLEELPRKRCDSSR